MKTSNCIFGHYKMKISVLIAAFNEEQFIEQCLLSVYAQNYDNIEVIVVNDGSTDKTGDIIDKLSKLYSSLRVVHKDNEGKAAAFNTCYNLASGELFLFVGADDVLPPGSIKERLKFMIADEVDLVRGRLKFLSNCNLNNKEIPRSKKVGNRSGGALLFNKRLAEVVFPIPQNFPNEDIWVNLIADYLDFKTAVCPSIIYILRLHENNSFSRILDFEIFSQKYYDREMILHEFLVRFEKFLDEKARSDLENRLAIEEMRFNGDLRFLFLRGNLRHKLWCLLNVSPKMYQIKLYLKRFLVGVV